MPLFAHNDLGLGSFLTAGVDFLGLQVALLFQEGAAVIKVRPEGYSICSRRFTQPLPKMISKSEIHPLPFHHNSEVPKVGVWLQLSDGTAALIHTGKDSSSLEEVWPSGSPEPLRVPLHSSLCLMHVSAAYDPFRKQAKRPENSNFWSFQFTRQLSYAVSYARGDNTAILAVERSNEGKVQVYRLAPSGNAGLHSYGKQHLFDLEGTLHSVHPMGLGVAVHNLSLNHVVTPLRITKEGPVPIGMSSQGGGPCSWTRLGMMKRDIIRGSHLFEDAWGRPLWVDEQHITSIAPVEVPKT